MSQYPINDKAHGAEIARRSHQHTFNGEGRESVAIVGMSCRFPGAADLRAFWQLLLSKGDAITEVPASRFDIDAVYDPQPATPGRIITRMGGFLDQIDQFDAAFFGIAPREAIYSDPQQRILLEVAWEALEDAGIVPDTLDGSNTGVFVGMCYNDYEDLQMRDPSNINIYANTGGFRSVGAGRISYALGLQGPSVSVDVACASSLVTIHMAVQSIQSGECNLALAGGVNLILHPAISIGFSQARMLSPDGRCKAFNAHADGFVRSEGAGIIALKPLSAAQADGDPIYGLIRGSAVNNDGRSSGALMTPSRVGQEAMLREAYQAANVDPNHVQYIEAHGTGTSVGDPVEAGALGSVISTARPTDQACLLGSVKTNIGHTEGAAGVAGLIKATLCLKHRTIPASLHCEQPNPNIPWEELNLHVVRETMRWPDSDVPALAGVSSFGICGTNAHAVLQEAPTREAHSANFAADQPFLLPISARSPEALQAFAQRYRDFFIDEQPPARLSAVAYTASLRRTHHGERLALVGNNAQTLAEQLDAYLQDQSPAGVSVGSTEGTRPKIAFVCPGQGSQWPGMARDLLQHEPVFRQAIEQCDAAMRPYVEWSLLDLLDADPIPAALEQIDVIQPALFAMEFALAALWQSRGITPDAIIGHSMGEVAAAAIAGALTLEDAARIICRRSRLLRRVSGQGAMAVVDLPIDEAQAAIADYSDQLAVAVSNSARSTVLAGAPEALNAVIETLQQQGVFCRHIQVDVASHSPQMDPLLDELGQLLDGVTPRMGHVPIYSTVTNTLVDGHEFDATYWVHNLREPVRFGDAIQHMLRDEYGVFIELSPHPILLPAIEQGVQHAGKDGTYIASMRRKEHSRRVFLEGLGRLWTHGYSVDWHAFYPNGEECVSLPSYPWQRERFWTETSSSQTDGGRSPGVSGHPLLGGYVHSSAQPGLHLWEADFRSTTVPYLRDHQVQDMVVMPAAAFVELALAAATAVAGSGAHLVEQMTFSRMLTLTEDSVQRVQVTLTEDGFGTAQVQIASQPVSTEAIQEWNIHATGTIRFAPDHRTPPSSETKDLAAIQARMLDTIDGPTLYQALQQRGYHYGSVFQGIARVWRGHSEALAQIAPPTTVAAAATNYQLHPALLDSCLQTLLAAIPQNILEQQSEQTYLPVALRSLHIVARPDTACWSYAVIHSTDDPTAQMFEGDVYVLAEDGSVVLEAHGLRMQRLDRPASKADTDTIADWLYTVQWQMAGNSAPTASPQADGRWLLFADQRGIAPALRAQLQAQHASVISVTPGATFQRHDPDTYEIDPTDPAALRRVLQEAFDQGHVKCQGIVHLWSLDIPPSAPETPALQPTTQPYGEMSVLHLVQALSHAGWREMPRLWLVTGGVHGVVASDNAHAVAQSPLIGLGRVIAYEHPELHCTRVDLDPQADAEVGKQLFTEIWNADTEDEIALRGKARYVARLARYQLSETTTAVPTTTRPVVVGRDAFQLEVDAPGRLDSMALRLANRIEPGPSEVEVQVHAAGLNFLDVLRALGICPGQTNDAFVPGIECAGTVTALGEEVEGVSVGDEVVIMSSTERGCFSSFAVVPASSVVPKPAQLDFAEAATIPAVFLTAYYGLQHLARMQPGERVLIHSAAGGVGLAAIQIAQNTGAVIFATAGTPEKRAYLQSLGIEHVFDSRSLDFAEQIMERTAGQGVDIVLNSLTGAAIPASLSCLASYGRFIEIGKKDIYQNSRLGLWPFQRNLAYFAVDLDRLVRDRPMIVQAILRDLLQQCADGTLTPLPHHVVPIDQAEEVFRMMAQAQHTGKLILSLEQQEIQVAPASNRTGLFQAQGTYLITGGLGGLGLTVAEWMVTQGARHLVLVGRSQPSAAAQEAIAMMQQRGADVRPMQADVVQADQVAATLATIAESMPPLRGIFHAAGVLDDGTVLRLNEANFQRAMAPKVNGAWNLHALTLDIPLDYFALFSSAAAILGSSGQANYAAGNTFLDALAHFRHTQGLPGLSINWGPWAEVGLAAAQENRGSRLAFRGMSSIDPTQGVNALAHLLRQHSPQISVMPFNVRQWCQFYPKASESALLALLIAEQETPSDTLKQTGGMGAALCAARPEQRRSMIETHVREQLAQVVRLPLTRLNAQTQLGSLGLDSLLALELRNRLENSLDLTLSASIVWNYPTVGALAEHLVNKLGLQLEVRHETPVDTNADVQLSSDDSEKILKLLGELQRLSVDESQVQQES